MMDETVEKMEVTESVPNETGSVKSKDFKYKLLERLNEPETSLTKSLTLAITIQTMFSKDLEVLEQLFEFYINKNQLEMSIDLWENELLKKVNLNETSHFDKHLNRITEQIISHLDKKKQNLQNLNNLDPRDEFYLKLFLKLSQTTQEKFITLILEKNKTKFSFLKIEPPSQQSDPNKKTTTTPSIDIKDLYEKLIDIKQDIFLTRDLLGIYKKLIPDYGLLLIDSLLNCEKSLYINFVQMSSNTSEPMINIERRSLNIMRRLCVVDLIPYFIQIIDKLDNRHCYRWIEKSLEFFTKYTLSSIKVEFNDSIKLNYSTVNLLNQNEIPNLGDQLKFTQIHEQLKDLIEYKYTEKDTPFSEVFKLLDEIGKKLDWPNLPLNKSIEDKLSILLSLKQKPDKQANISISSLNKQFSFYAIAVFFNKLIEFNAVSNDFFSNKLILVKRYKYTMNQPVGTTNSDLTSQTKTPIDFSVVNLVYSLKLWHKFNSHKEFLTVVTKCLSNSKLDLMTIYKNFISHYYINFSLGLNLQTANQPQWDTLSTLNSKQKLPALAHLFMNEKCDSFEVFFKELLSLIEQSKLEDETKDYKNYTKFMLSNIQFNLFEYSTKNVLNYFSWLIIEKLIQLLEIKKLLLHKYLIENDQLLGYFLVLIQLNLTNDNLIIDVYDTIYQIIKSKGVFIYPEFFDYIYDTQILQDFSALNHTYKVNMQIGCESLEELLNKFISQINSTKSNEKYDLIEKFLKQNSQSISDYFKKMFNV